MTPFRSFVRIQILDDSEVLQEKEPRHKPLSRAKQDKQDDRFPQALQRNS